MADVVHGEGQRSPRAQELKALSYAEYLKTDHWAETRALVLSRAQGKCEACKQPRERLQVHHRTYKRVGGEHPRDLRALCRRCHMFRHPKVARAAGLYKRRRRR